MVTLISFDMPHQAIESIQCSSKPNNVDPDLILLPLQDQCQWSILFFYFEFMKVTRISILLQPYMGNLVQVMCEVNKSVVWC